jgi:hypothetical protein
MWLGSRSARLAYSADDVGGMVLGDDPDHDPPKTLKHLETADVLPIVVATRLVLTALILGRDLDVLPAHVQIRFSPAPFVAD